MKVLKGLLRLFFKNALVCIGSLILAWTWFIEKEDLADYQSKVQNLENLNTEFRFNKIENIIYKGELNLMANMEMYNTNTKLPLYADQTIGANARGTLASMLASLSLCKHSLTQLQNGGFNTKANDSEYQAAIDTISKYFKTKNDSVLYYLKLKKDSTFQGFNESAQLRRNDVYAKLTESKSEWEKKYKLWYIVGTILILLQKIIKELKKPIEIEVTETISDCG